LTKYIFHTTRECVFYASTVCFSLLTVHVCDFSVACFFCMFFTSMLYVFFFFFACYFSRINLLFYSYLSLHIFSIHRFPLHPCFHMFHLYAITACMAVLPLHLPSIHPSTNVHSLLPCLLSSFVFFCLLRMIVFILCNGPSNRMC
jgi:hypothetical protein